MSFGDLFATREGLAMLAGLISLVGFVPYVLAVLRGRTRPSRSTWAIWTLVGIILCASYGASGAAAMIWVPLSYVAGPLVILALSVRFGVGGWTPLDRFCLIASAASTVLWALTGDPLVALFLNLAIDSLGTIPTVVKTWREPESEDSLAWSIFLVGAMLNVAVIEPRNLASLSYPVYLLLLAVIMVGLLLHGRLASRRS